MARQQIGLQRYKSNLWLWCIASLAVFVAIGASVRLRVKGVDVFVARRLVEDLGSGPLETLISVICVLVWVLVAVVVGWILQGVIVMGVSRMYGKAKSSS